MRTPGYAVIDHDSNGDAPNSSVFHQFNMEQVRLAQDRLSSIYGADWLQMPEKMIGAQDFSFQSLQEIATIFEFGYDRIYVNDPSIKPLIPSQPESYTIKLKWIKFLNKEIELSLGGNYSTFVEIYDSLEKVHWVGNEAWKVLSLGGDHNNAIMWTLKNFCWFKSLEGKPITFQHAKIIHNVFTSRLAGYFEPKLWDVISKDVDSFEALNIYASNSKKASDFVKCMLDIRNYDMGYAYIRDEVEKRFPM